MQELIECDVLVIGSGIAGSIAALRLAEAGIHVVVVTRSKNPEESTHYMRRAVSFIKEKMTHRNS
jgi:flavin-dependent dehydrogenase